MLSFSVLSSGSRANCLYVAGRNTRVLIDCGLSGRETARRLALLGVDADSIDAIVVTHEHDDHVAGVRVFSKRHNAAVYANRNTFSASRHLQEIEPEACCEFLSEESFYINELLFEPFRVQHDAAEPVAFRIGSQSASLGVVTDLGVVSAVVKERLSGLRGLVLEANHCPDMLLHAPYPWSLKQRIRSSSGHLSNHEAAAVIMDFSKESVRELEVLVAAHVSEKSNTYDLAKQSLARAWAKHRTSRLPDILSAGVAKPTELRTIC